MCRYFFSSEADSTVAIWAFGHYDGNLSIVAIGGINGNCRMLWELAGTWASLTDVPGGSI